MAAFWLLSVPAGLWATRTVGASVNNALFAQSAPQPPNLSLDYEGALASADAALLIRPLSPTADHLRTLVKMSAEKLRELVQTIQNRMNKRSWSRWVRDPDFSVENELLAREIDTLKSRVQLFLNVILIFPTGTTIDTVDKGNLPFATKITAKEEFIETDSDDGDVSVD